MNKYLKIATNISYKSIIEKKSMFVLFKNIKHSKFNLYKHTLKNYSSNDSNNPQIKTKESKKQKEEFSLEDRDTDNKEATESFITSINNIIKEEKDDPKSIESFLKIFNTKMYKQNLELSNKLYDLFNNTSNDSKINESKVFVAINEINKVNIDNTSKLLKMFLSEVLKNQNKLLSNKKMLLHNNYNVINMSIKYLLLVCIFIWLIVNITKKYDMNSSLLSLISKNTLDNIAFEIIKVCSDNNSNCFFYDTSEEELNIFSNTDVQAVLDNSLTLNSNLFLIGDKCIGKTKSLLNYIKKQSIDNITKSNINNVFYIDLKKQNTKDIKNEFDFLIKIFSFNLNNHNKNKSTLIKETTNLIDEEKIKLIEKVDTLINESKILNIYNDTSKYFPTYNKNKLLIIDNFEYNANNNILDIINKLNHLNYKIVLSSNSSFNIERHLIKCNAAESYVFKYLKADRTEALNKLKIKHLKGGIANISNKINYSSILYNDDLHTIITNNIHNSNLLEISDLLNNTNFNLNLYIEQTNNLLVKELNNFKLLDPDGFVVLKNIYNKIYNTKSNINNINNIINNNNLLLKDELLPIDIDSIIDLNNYKNNKALNREEILNRLSLLESKNYIKIKNLREIYVNNSNLYNIINKL